MADGHGGYRKPEKPAAVSGPGKFSKRTDGGPAQVMSATPDQPYGDATAQMNEQRVSPMAGMAPPPKPAPAQQMGETPNMPVYNGGSFGAPSNRPNEPTTAGVPIGPGPGPSLLPQASAPSTGAMTQMLQQLAARDMTGVLAPLYQAALNRGV